MPHRRNTIRPVSAVAAAVAMAIGMDAMAAQPSSEEALEELIVTGTRAAGVAVSDSATPVQLVGAEVLENTGKDGLMEALGATVPSFQAQSFGGDMANQTLQAALRGLSPNHTLTLVDGKRRHTTANMAVLNGLFQGGAGVDLNFLPMGSIERVEVLTDGAAAIYGTDAIAGVVNIVTKKRATGASLDVTYGGYSAGDGQTRGISGNIGYAPVPGAYLNFTAEYRDHNHTMRGGPETRIYDITTGQPWPVGTNGITQLDIDGATQNPNYPYNNRILGDGEYEMKLAALAAGYAYSEDGEVYFYGTYGTKEISSFENYRLPSWTFSDALGVDTYPYPMGFDPKEMGDETDYSMTVGINGIVADGWHWDLSTVYGKDAMKVYTLDSINFPLYAQTGVFKTDFYDGTLSTTQWTTGLDVSKELSTSMPVTVAFGAEYREDSYEIEAGEEASYLLGGASSFPGYMPESAGLNKRDQKALYLNFIVKPLPQWTVDIAGRYEDYSDFGDVTIGKLTTRYDFGDTFAVRGTWSTGFRAPTLAEGFYSAPNVGPESTFWQMPANDPATKALFGNDGLQPEESINLSLGLVFQPLPNLLLTLDYFDIRIKDRITGTNSLLAVDDELIISRAVESAIIDGGIPIDPRAYGPGGSVGLQTFINGINTSTTGFDLVASYETPFDWGSVNWTLGATKSKTKLGRTMPMPGIVIADTIATTGDPATTWNDTLFGSGVETTLEDNPPDFVVNLGALIKIGAFDISLREKIVGKAQEKGVFSQDGEEVPFVHTVKTTPITSLDVTWKASDKLAISVGADNLFDEYPETNELVYLDDATNGFNSSGGKYTVAPFGFNGAYYYGKVKFTF